MGSEGGAGVAMRRAMLQSVAHAASRFARWVNKHTGYTEDQLRGGLQVLLLSSAASACLDRTESS